MTRFTAFTRVLSRWGVRATLGAILLRIWGEGMFWVAHLVLSNYCCDGTWFDAPLHFPMVLIATLWAALAAGVLYCVLYGLWMGGETLAMNFRRALAKERQ